MNCDLHTYVRQTHTQSQAMFTTCTVPYRTVPYLAVLYSTGTYNSTVEQQFGQCFNELLDDIFLLKNDFFFETYNARCNSFMNKCTYGTVRYHLLEFFYFRKQKLIHDVTRAVTSYTRKIESSPSQEICTEGTGTVPYHTIPYCTVQIFFNSSGFPRDNSFRSKT